MATPRVQRRPRLQHWRLEPGDAQAWLLDYNGLCFHVAQASSPRTGAWQDLKQALKRDDDSVWDHLADWHRRWTTIS